MMLTKALNRTTASRLACCKRATQCPKLALLMPQHRTFAPITKYKFDDEDWEPNKY